MERHFCSILESSMYPATIRNKVLTEGDCGLRYCCQDLAPCNLPDLVFPFHLEEVYPCDAASVSHPVVKQQGTLYSMSIAGDRPVKSPILRSACMETMWWAPDSLCAFNCQCLGPAVFFFFSLFLLYRVYTNDDDVGSLFSLSISKRQYRLGTHSELLVRTRHLIVHGVAKSKWELSVLAKAIRLYQPQAWIHLMMIQWTSDIERCCWSCSQDEYGQNQLATSATLAYFFLSGQRVSPASGYFVQYYSIPERYEILRVHLGWAMATSAVPLMIWNAKFILVLRSAASTTCLLVEQQSTKWVL